MMTTEFNLKLVQNKSKINFCNPNLGLEAGSKSMDSTTSPTRLLGSCRVKGARLEVQGAGCRVQGARLEVQGAGCRVQGAGCRV